MTDQIISEDERRFGVLKAAVKIESRYGVSDGWEFGINVGNRGFAHEEAVFAKDDGVHGSKIKPLPVVSKVPPYSTRTSLATFSHVMRPEVWALVRARMFFYSLKMGISPGWLSKQKISADVSAGRGWPG